MERLTYDFAIGETHCWEIHGADNLICADVCKNQGDKGCENCPIRKAIDRLAAYEDTGLMPEEIVELSHAKQKQDEAIAHAREVAEGCPAEGCPAEGRQCDYQHDKLADWLEELKAYRETRLTPEDVKRVEWIYRPINWTGCDLEKAVEEAEKALGFKLFFWQKAYILFGEFRQMGATTAEILRDLLNVSAPPIDYSRRAETEREKFYRRELREMKRKLDDAGILTRAVFFSTGEKRAYMYEKRQEG